MLDNPDKNMINKTFCLQLSMCFERHMGLRSKRTFGLCWGQLEKLKPRKKIYKTGLSWMKQTLISASDRGRNYCSDIFISNTHLIKFST
jgi:hypothetical protein